MLRNIFKNYITMLTYICNKYYKHVQRTAVGVNKITFVGMKAPF